MLAKEQLTQWRDKERGSSYHFLSNKAPLTGWPGDTELSLTESCGWARRSLTLKSVLLANRGEGQRSE